MDQSKLVFGFVDERPGGRLLTVGVIFPALVIAIELITGLCANMFFDPLPTPAHALLALAVPAANLGLWLALRGRSPIPPRWLMLAGGAAAAIALCYALIFLPLFPFALIGILAFGVGLLPFGPVAGAYAAIRQTTKLYWGLGERYGRRAWAGAGLGVLAVLLADLPSTATLLALSWAEEDSGTSTRPVTLMRTLGDRDMLLRLSYEGDRRANGLGSALVSVWSGPFDTRPAGGSSTAAARELYYRVTGEPFNLRPPPFRRRDWEAADEFEFDADQGGTQVGGRVRGLGLASSRMDGSVSAADALAYLEWTMEFDNASQEQSEARLTLALPPGAVASRATLWVNGEPREAVVAGKAEARAAYEQVVVRERRDPLLVTAAGADRLLVQAFPVQPQSRLKLRIGMTAPLEIGRDERLKLALPAIVDRNFSIASEAPHLVWIESKTALGSTNDRLRKTGLGQLRGSLGDAELSGARPLIDAGPAVTGPRGAPLPGTGEETVVHQDLRLRPADPFAPVMLVVDGSAAGERARDGLLAALSAIPARAKVGLVIAGPDGAVIEPRPWSTAQRGLFAEALRSHRFEGGQDNADALARAAALLANQSRGAILWVHGPQPVRFARSSAELDQVSERSEALPKLHLYQIAPGPQRVLEDNDWLEEARTIPATGAVAEDLSAALSGMMGAAPRLQALRTTDAIGLVGAIAGSPHIARLWAAEEVSRLARADRPKGAVALAARAGIVTPVSGAVVLETDADYKRAGLKVPKADEVPTVPEPDVWALLLLASMFALWFWRRSRAQAVAA